MENNYLNNLRENTNYTQTENGAKTLESTFSKNLDFFALGGSFRNRNRDDIINLFQNAYNENPETAIKILFYLRDIREGQGERRVFREILNYIGNFIQLNNYNIFDYIVQYGRYDDLYSFVKTPLEPYVFNYMKQQFEIDMNEEYPTLLSKWLKSLNSSNQYSKQLAIKTRDYFELSNKDYRQKLSYLRNKLNLIETLLTQKRYDEIDFEKIPSKALLQYRKSFSTNMPEKFVSYLDSVKKGNSKMNTKTLYPYEIIKKVLYERNYDDTLDVMWNNLPNYCVDNGRSIAVVDTSGSMSGEPMTVAYSLGMYLAERNPNETFKNHFITFSNIPKIVKLEGKTIFDRVKSFRPIVENTNVQAVFNLLLETAIQNNVPQNEMIETIYIISDMEFDIATRGNEKTNYEVIRQKYLESGYELPTIVFWNVNARNNQVPVRYDENGVVLVSGLSPTIFSQVMSKTTPEQFMFQVLEKYNNINIF